MLIHDAGEVGELHLEPQGNYMTIRWKKLFQRKRENILLVERLLVEVAARKVSKVIIDMTGSSGVFPDEFLVWAQGPGMVQSAKAGMRAYVTVQPASALSKMSVTRWQDVASTNVAGIKVTSVASRELAVAWLAAQ